MKVVHLMAEMTGTRELLINGRQSKSGDADIDEKVLEKNLAPEQLWDLICTVQKLQIKLQHVYQKARIRAGEVNPDTMQRMQGNISASSGIPGTNIRKL